MRDIRFLRFRLGSGNIPPFWIQQKDRAGKCMHPAVRKESHGLWPWAYRYVEQMLRDPPRAAELLDEVARAVSHRLREKSEVGRNLRGYLIAAFHHRVGLELLRTGRLTYEGSVQELQGKHPIAASDWVVPLEAKICVGQIVALMPPEARRIVHYRLLDFSWKEIEEALGIPITLAKSRYYYGIKRACERMSGGTSGA